MDEMQLVTRKIREKLRHGNEAEVRAELLAEGFHAQLVDSLMSVAMSMAAWRNNVNVNASDDAREYECGEERTHSDIADAGADCEKDKQGNEPRQADAKEGKEEGNCEKENDQAVDTEDMCDDE